MQSRTKKLVILSMLSALAYLAMVFGRVPAVLFLKYDPKDIVIVISGFLFGPLAAFIVTATVSLLEMVTVSDTGFIGLAMNIISGASFACVASAVYRWRHNLSGAVIGLLAGCLSMTAVMLLWNYLITPIYMGLPRSAVTALLIPAFLPFNLLKGGFNAAVTMIIYKPVATTLRLSGLHMESALPVSVNRRQRIGILLVSVFIIISAVLVILAWQGKI